MLTGSSLSADTLILILEQSIDCVKFLSLDGDVVWMNRNGMCAMEIDDFADVAGRPWCTLWPEDLQETIRQSCLAAATGELVRFTAACPSARGTPHWWDVSVTAVNAPDGSPTGFLSISRDITELEASRSALVLANLEMRHRLSNTYAIVGGLMAGFARGTPDREVFARDMQKRLHALYTAQTLFASGDGPHIVADLLTELVAPFVGGGRSVTLGHLSSTAVDRGVADAIALTLGELTVNSVKHGALGADGSLHLSTRDDADGLHICWKERSDRRVKAHDRDGGQGLGLIGQIVRSRAGTLVLDWQDYGLDATIIFPATH